MEAREEILSVFRDAIENRTLKKAVFSKSFDQEIRKTEATLVLLSGKPTLKTETFRSDNKAISRNYPIEEAAELLSSFALTGFGQTNILTSAGECEVRVSKKGKIFVGNHVKSADAAPAIELKTPEREKHYLIDAEKYPEFLKALGVSDENGRVFDKKRAKYRQINRFVEILDDVYDKLPADGVLTVCDLCCGKSYLTFAVYFYLTSIKNRKVEMYGVDLKADCIAFCAELAEKLGADSLHFLCGDVLKFEIPDGKKPDLVISLHACDTATDVVLAFAVLNKAGMILSTPCCHHETFHQMKTENLGFIERQSILKQKLADAATDALRTLRLEAEGYRAQAMELIDPEETPKNVLIRAIYDERLPLMRRKTAYEEYKNAVRMLGIDPTLEKLLTASDQQ